MNKDTDSAPSIFFHPRVAQHCLLSFSLETVLLSVQRRKEKNFSIYT